MNFKKKVNGSWTDTPHYIHNTSTDTITTLPAVVYPNAATATAGLKGQAVQSGTPTPTSPIQPQECGERTGNLFDKNTTPVSLYYQTAREVITQTAGVVSIIIPVSPNVTYTFNNPTGNRNRICETETVPEIDDTVINYIASDGNVSITLTTSNNTHYILWWVGYQQTYSDIKDALSVNLGSTALPYEPYGYKIPISSANTATPIYLGEVETTRKIVKYEFTGQENWYVEGSDIFYTDPITEAVRYAPICSHFFGVDTLSGNNQVTISQSLRINIKTNSITHTASDFKAYLAQQYAAGTPVTVWYVLVTPTTGIVNEPLRKIGDYADEVSGITIPTTAGANTIDVDTTLKPSEVTVNYKGWHPVQSVHERDNGEWD